MIDVALDQVVGRVTQLPCEMSGDCRQSEPVGLFPAAGAVRGVAPPAGFRDAIVQALESGERMRRVRTAVQDPQGVLA
ncbi:hypothetical protein AB0I22_20660 [Streptomyces sp. NPDC050610]|uniref:hypothetical protein n=1 Tax=Streptomyces sp. NPDC050610 TaxID=3157097 RepID=UPI0034397154